MNLNAHNDTKVTVKSDIFVCLGSLPRDRDNLEGMYYLTQSKLKHLINIKRGSSKAP